jgi:hypothetical protein
MSIDLPRDTVCPVDGGGAEDGVGAVIAGPSAPGARAIGAGGFSFSGVRVAR